MKAEWVTTRPNGEPLRPGTFCRRLDPEDGTNPIYVYGKTQDEVNDKIALTSLHARRALDRQAETPGNGAPPVLITVPARKRLTADETAQATLDLANPAKAGEAAAKLVQDATGVDLRQQAMNNFKALAADWTNEHPEFYNCKPNRSLLATRLGQIVNGDVALITKELMTQAFNQMISAGDLVEDPGDALPSSEPAETLPGENQVHRSEATRSGRNGTGTRSTSFRAAPGTQTRTLKYTREQIDRMPLAKSKALIESGDKDYAEACEVYYPSTVKATA